MLLQIGQDLNHFGRENKSTKMNKFRNNQREFILRGNKILIFGVEKTLAKNFSKFFKRFLKKF